MSITPRITIGACSFFYQYMTKLPANPPSWRKDTVLPLPYEVKANAWAVDASCSGNPGPMEYQCIDLQTGAQVFHYGPLHGTNNIGEFLAIVHALALMQQKGITDKVIYSDSVNAQLWVQKKQCKTKLARTPQTEQASHAPHHHPHLQVGDQEMGRDTC